MVKKLTSMNIEADTIKQCRERFINMAGVCQKALDEALGKETIELNQEIVNCEFCGMKQEKAKVINGKATDGLTWLYPDEKWICSHCLATKTRQAYGSSFSTGFLIGDYAVYSNGPANISPESAVPFLAPHSCL